MTKEPNITPKPGWKTLAIGRHLIDVPGDAVLIPQWRFDGDSLQSLPAKTEADFNRLIAKREAELRAAMHLKTKGSMFLERLNRGPTAVLLTSFAADYSEYMHRYEAYFRAENFAILHAGEFSPSRKHVLLKLFDSMQNWRALSPGQIPSEPGFVAGDMLLLNTELNPESWSLTIRLAGKPDVALSVQAYVVSKVGESLRERAGGVLMGMLGMAAGLKRLRNRERPVGPIWAEEILVAGTQNGKRGYGFKWEAPGKANSLAEPQINVQLEVGESAYETNAESFKTDDEALAVWDTLVESIRLRPGAA